jgi:hypothetical protein
MRCISQPSFSPDGSITRRDFYFESPEDASQTVKPSEKQSVAEGPIMARLAFTCPNCKALYEVVKVEAGPETFNRDITCQVCGSPVSGREGKFVLKYFFLRKGIPSRRRA